MKVITATDAMVHPRVMATMNSYSLTVERLIGERDALKADAERLDFMIKARAYVVSDASCCDGYWLQYARPDGSTWVGATEHVTPRSAIDAAMKEPS